MLYGRSMTYSPSPRSSTELSRTSTTSRLQLFQWQMGAFVLKRLQLLCFLVSSWRIRGLRQNLSVETLRQSSTQTATAS
ncbi:unnamed protein product [Symbiodinium necroappetens]|uniref:Uncharacterized protein n=1 Tax=Symbiodinium necroappetens TaxID=1628268 RepID=A0A812YMT8_9DINO|nr:unnamed protein product [Symbiodinium necroappetens]